jgi:hypothetical protein
LSVTASPSYCPNGSARPCRKATRSRLTIPLSFVARVRVERGAPAGRPGTAGLREQVEVLLAWVFDVIDERYREPLSAADVAAGVALGPGTSQRSCADGPVAPSSTRSSSAGWRPPGSCSWAPM